jgi:hypothetical protein
MGIFSTKKAVVIAIVAFSLIITVAMQQDFSQSNTYDGPPRAAIIDQLHDDIESIYFQEKATEYLETAGYEVDLFTTQQLTVDFYKKLPKMNYEYIVFRTHAIGNDDGKKEPVSLFTGEKYRDDKYITEQLSGQIGKGAPYMSSIVEVSADLSELNSNKTSIEIDVTPTSNIVDNSNPYFLIGAKYVDEIMEGKFPNSVLILGGCSTLSNPSLADSLIKRGASSVVGWDDLVGSVNNDNTMLTLLENHLIEKMELEDAVESAMDKSAKGSKYNATFSYYNKI